MSFGENIGDLFDDDRNDLSDRIRYTLGRNKIKYAVLNSKIKKYYKDVHINLNGIFKNLYTKILKKNEKNDDDYSDVIASFILNTVAHYRHYFNSSSPKIYVYSYNTFESQSITKAVKIASKICEYIPGCYYILVPKKVNANILMSYFIKRTSLVLTKELTDLQLLSKDVDVLHLNKDDSCYYTISNVYEILSEGKFTDDLSYKLIGPYLFFSGTGMDNKGVAGFGKLKTMKLFANLIKMNVLYNGTYYTYDDFVKDFQKYSGDIDLKNFIANFTSHSVEYIFTRWFSVSKGKLLDNYIIDKFSKNGLKEFNAKYFGQLDSLMLDYLMEYNDDGSSDRPDTW